ncbi:MAG: permease [Tannerella sp.]|jgi:hypothetical protein|nr:permease [Tannerella sp.]
MKKTTLLTAMLTSLLLLSCNDDDLELTKKGGQPSLFEQNSTKIYFSYQDNQITQIKKKNGSTIHYTYENGSLSNLSFTPPPNVADGHGSSTFIQESENKIRVESWGEPSFDIHVQEIEVNNNQVKITEIGSFQQGPDGLTKVYEGKRYTQITLDPATKNILKREVFSIETSELLATYSYEYDNNPGTMSAIDWPLWLRIYFCEDNSFSYYSQYRQYFNYKNNLIKETADNKEENTEYTVNYTYTYNKSGYPITATNDKYQEANKITIRY